VRAYCGAGDSSAWAGPSTFTTLCSVVSTFPATEDFENGGSIPNCWIDDPANSESWLYATSATYAASSDHTSGSGYLAWIDDSSPYNATPSNLLSPVYNTTALTAPRLVFYYWIGAGESGSTLDVDVYDGSVWQTSLLSLGTQNGWLEAILDLTAYSNANLQIRFSANEQTSDFDCDISIDDVTVEEGPTCPDPIADSTNTITLTSAHVYWTENATATKWQVEYGIAGYTPGTGTQLTPTVVGTDTTITGLTHTTAYDWYVRSICTVGDTSEWSNSASFSTLCGAIASFPFTQNFDSWTTSAPGFSCTSDGSVPLENCWENVVGDDMDWDIFTGATGSSGTGPSSDHTSGSGNYLYIESSSCNDVTAGILSPEFDFTGIYPQLSFWYHLYGDDMGTMAIQASTNGGTSWSANLWSMSGDQGDLWQQVMVNTGAYAGEPGVIFRITGTTGTDFTSDMAIDDFGITVLTDPTLSYSPDSVNYGECPLNNLSAEYYTQTFLVQNVGPGTLTISGILLAGTDPTEFTLNDTNTYPKGLNSTDSLFFEVMFDPQTTGDKSAIARIQTPARADHDIPLAGNAYVAPAQNLTGEYTITYTNELDWDPPLPENEIRYDNGIITNWFWVNDPSSDQHYFYTRFTAPVDGDVDYVSIFTRKNNPGANWNEILVCPDNGSGEPNLASPYITFSDVQVNSTTGEWLLLDLSTSAPALTQGTDFFIVTHWPDTSTTGLGPYVGVDAANNYGRCAWTDDGGSTWANADASFIMRAYMSTAMEGGYALQAGNPAPGIENLEVRTTHVDESQAGIHKQTSLPVPGIWMKNAGRAFIDYTVHRGTSTGTYGTHYTGIGNTDYTDNTGLVNGTTYFYAVTAHYSGGQVSDTSNEISLSVLDLPAAPTNPSPVDSATDLQPNIDLAWVNNGNVQFIDLYMSQTESDVTNKVPGARILDNVADTNAYDPGMLAEAKWFWRVVAKDGVSTEIDGDVWEFTINDILAPTISYTPLANTISLAARTITDTIIDISGIPTSGVGLPVLYWKINTSGSWTAATGTSMGSDQYDFTFGTGTSNGDTVFYYTVAQDNSINKNTISAPLAGAGGFTSDPPAAATPPDTPEFYVVLLTLSGTKTIGSTGDYPTLTGDGGFFQAINGGAVIGSLTATIQENITEPGTHALNEVFRSGGNHMITIEPDVPESAAITVSGNVSGGLIKLNGADYVTFTGSGNELAFVNTAASNARVFEFSNGASHNTITECDLATGGKSSTTNYCIYSNGTGNDTNTFSGNHLMQSYYGIYLYGNSITYNGGNIISGNTIGVDTNTVAGMDTLIAKYGIYANYQTGIAIFDNEIKNLFFSSVPYGIYMLNSTSVSIFRNYIHDIIYTASTGYGPQGIYIDFEEYTSGDANSEIYNNIIRHIAGDSDAPSFVPAGIRILGGAEITTGINIYYNSIYMQPDTVYGLGDYEDPIWCAGIIIDDGPTGINLVNNVIYNSLGERNSEPVTSYGSAVWCKSTTSPFATIEHNLYYADTCDNNFAGMSGITSPPSTYDLAGWKTFTGQDKYSLWGDPQFNSNMLGLTNPGSPALGEGTSLPPVTNDYFNTARHVYFPTMGATEYTPAHVAIWTGNISADWNNAGNWDNSAIPDQNSNIAIPTDPASNPDRFPNIGSGNNVMINKMIVDDGAVVNVQSGGTLTIQE